MSIVDRINQIYEPNNKKTAAAVYIYTFLYYQNE